MRLDAMNGNELADFLAQVATLLGGTELSAIDSNVRTDLLTAIGTIPAALESAVATVLVKREESEAATTVKDALASSALALARQVRDTLKAGNAPKDQYDLCGYDYPSDSRAPVTAEAPSALIVRGLSGFNTGKFVGNNKSGTVSYQIFRRAGDDGVWGIHLTGSSTSFRDNDVVAGQYYEYKIRAAAATNNSAFSNTFVCYGVA